MTNTNEEEELLAAFGIKKETKTTSPESRSPSPKGPDEANFIEFMKGEMNPPQAREESIKKDKEAILKAYDIKEPKPRAERRLSQERIVELEEIKSNYEKFMAGDGIQATPSQSPNITKKNQIER